MAKHKVAIRSNSDGLKKLYIAFYGAAVMASSQMANAAGVDTGSSSMTSIKTWLMTWVPLACTCVIILIALGWMFHMVALNTAARFGAGLLVIGSASYITGLFGLTGG
ncbi:TPA: TrbC/VirB2 family protein [Pseudomonas putida]